MTKSKDVNQQGIIQRAASENSNPKPQSLKDWVQKMTPQIAKALPQVITPERFTRIALTALSSNPKLAECDRNSFLGGLMQAAQLGLEPNTPLGQAYLIPFRNKKRGIVECQFQVGYKGLIDLAYRSGDVKTIQAYCVYENDLFEYELGLEPKLIHKPAKSNRGNLEYVYAIFKLKNEGYGFEVMSVEDVINHAKKYSQAYSSSYSPWKSNFEEMAKKGLALDTPIPTIEGWKTMKELEVGDVVFDMYGKPTKVKAVSEIKNIDCYELSFYNGETIICDDEHRWVAQHSSNASRNVRSKGWNVYTINELFDLHNDGQPIILPVTDYLDIRPVELPIDPWLYGYWLGNGHSHHAAVCCDIDVQEEIVEKINSTRYSVGKIRRDTRSNAINIGIIGGLKKKLKELDLLGEKKVIQDYLRGSKEQRLSFLRGLMDSDGTIDNNRGRAIFCNTNEELANTVYELASSLGEIVHISSRVQEGFDTEALCYRVEWLPSFVPVTLNYKKANINKKILIQNRPIKSIKKVESVPTKCIAVDSETETYLASKSFIPTHNTVLKKALKYAPIKTEFIKATVVDESVSSVKDDDYEDIEVEYRSIDDFEEMPEEVTSNA